ncbi:MAG: hypothetical protein ACC669_03140, partial [bacterium]
MHQERDFEYLSYDELLIEQTRMIRELIAGEWQKAPGFVRRLEEAGVTADTLEEPGDIVKFPILKKSDLPAIQAADPP